MLWNITTLDLAVTLFLSWQAAKICVRLSNHTTSTSTTVALATIVHTVIELFTYTYI